MIQKEVTIEARGDKYPLRGTIFIPDVEKMKSKSEDGVLVIISAATGVMARYYEKFAQFLCEDYLCCVITFDYRGIGKSKPHGYSSLRGFSATISDWARKDIAGVVDYALIHFPKSEIVICAQSVGFHAHAIIQADVNQKITRMLAVSTNNAFYGLRKCNIHLVMTVIFFMLLRKPLQWIYGYFPFNSLFGVMEDLPSGVMDQWSWFCLHREYFVGYDHKPIHDLEGLGSFKAPIVSFNSTDDEFSGKKSFESMLTMFRNSECIFHCFVHPTSEQIKQASNPKTAVPLRLGHVGFFKEKVKEQTNLWREAAEWIVYGRYPTLSDKAESQRAVILRSKL